MSKKIPDFLRGGLNQDRQFLTSKTGGAYYSTKKVIYRMLKQDFFERQTVKVAVDLLGCVLVRITKRGAVLKGRIVETEAYLGLKDDSCHSFGGKKTERTKVMYLPGGRAYVYFTYGMHHCFNIVTAGKEEPEAVLIRAVEPLKGIAKMRKNRCQKTPNRDTVHLTNGPGKLCQAFDICRIFTGKSLGKKNRLYIEQGTPIPAKNILARERIGLSPALSSCYWPLRFYIKDSPFVSRI